MKVPLLLLVIIFLSCAVLAQQPHELKAEQELVAAWKGMGDTFDRQHPFLEDLQQNYLRFQPLFDICAPEVRASRRQRRLLAWDKAIEEQQKGLDFMKSARKAESEY